MALTLKVDMLIKQMKTNQTVVASTVRRWVMHWLNIDNDVSEKPYATQLSNYEMKSTSWFSQIGSLKDGVHGQHFTNNHAVTAALRKWFMFVGAEFYLGGIQSHVHEIPIKTMYNAHQFIKWNGDVPSFKQASSVQYSVKYHWFVYWRLNSRRLQTSQWYSLPSCFLWNRGLCKCSTLYTQQT